MAIDEITTVLQAFITKHFDVPANDPSFNDSIDLFSYGYIDSLGAADLTAFVQGRFGVEFTDADWVSFPLSNISEIASFVSKRQAGEL